MHLDNRYRHMPHCCRSGGWRRSWKSQEACCKVRLQDGSMNKSTCSCLKTCNYSITPLVPTSSPTHPATPLPSPNPSGPVSNSSAALLSNSSIATATCANGNRWLFFQHLTGSIYGSQYVLSSLQYTTTSKELNFTIPKIGTNLGASCVYINSLFYNYTPLDIGDYVSEALQCSKSAF